HRPDRHRVLRQLHAHHDEPRTGVRPDVRAHLAEGTLFMANNRYKLYRLHADGEFHGVIDATARIAADYIQDESPDTAHHAQRAALATIILDEDAADGSPERRRAIRHFALQAALNGDVLVAAF